MERRSSTRFSPTEISRMETLVSERKEKVLDETTDKVPELEDLSFESRSSKDETTDKVPELEDLSFEARSSKDETIDKVPELEDLSFEARSSKDSAWHVVAIFLAHRKRSSGEVEVRVRFKGFGAEEDEWINVRKSIRQESIPLESSECGTIAKGDLVLCFKESNDYALHFDAHVLDIQRKHHCIRECRCVFHVKYLHDQSQEMVNLKRLSRRPRNL